MAAKLTCTPSFCRVNPDTIGCVCKGNIEFDMNTLRVDEGIIESGRKLRSCRFKNVRIDVDEALSYRHDHHAYPAE